MRRLALTLFCLVALAGLAACSTTQLYTDMTYPEARYDPGDQ